MKKNHIIKLAILLVLAFFFGRNVQAASLDLSADKNTLKQNEVFTLRVTLNTEGQAINTIAGDLKYDINLIKADNINIGGSFVNFWIEKPDIKIPGTIHFSGITPGGINTQDGEVFNIIFTALKEGDTNIGLTNIDLFLNDGQGSRVATTTKNLDIKIAQGIGAGNTSDLFSSDKAPPEKFNIMLAQSPLLFDNKWFIAFDTMDKGSGMGRYEVRESLTGLDGSYVVALSPYLLKDQTLKSSIYVKAIDKAGNEKVEKLGAQNKFVLFLQLIIIGIILLICVLIGKKLWLKFTR